MRQLGVIAVPNANPKLTHGAELPTNHPVAALVITIMAAGSQWEREAIGERTRDALRHKRGKGERVGNIGFGYRLAADGVHVEPDPAEQASLAAIRSLRLGGHSLRAVAGVLNESGHRTRRGTQWRLESVVRAINQEAAKGQPKVA
jgi:site-specific DNA recombinase